MTAETQHDDDMLAAEFALALLEGDELREARRRLAEDPAFAAAVSAWTARLATLADEVDEVAPSPASKQALLTRVFDGAQEAKSIWQRLWLWQGLAVASLLLAGFLALQVGPDAQGPIYTAEIVADAGDFRVIAVVDKTANQVILTRTLGEAPPGRILQVWAHGPDKPAQSVGLWPVGETVRLDMPTEIAAVEGVLTLGVSEEPPGGSPTGLPSGRVFGTVDIPGVRADG